MKLPKTEYIDVDVKLSGPVEPMGLPPAILDDLCCEFHTECLKRTGDLVLVDGVWCWSQMALAKAGIRHR